jgi:hypothetical protein
MPRPRPIAARPVLALRWSHLLLPARTHPLAVSATAALHGAVQHAAQSAKADPVSPLPCFIVQAGWHRLAAPRPTLPRLGVLLHVQDLLPAMDTTLDQHDQARRLGGAGSPCATAASPDVVAPSRLLEAESDLRVEVRVRPRHDCVLCACSEWSGRRPPGLGVAASARGRYLAAGRCRPSRCGGSAASWAPRPPTAPPVPCRWSAARGAGVGR